MKKKNLRQILIPAFIITACIPITIFTVISQARLKKSTLDNMNNQAEADLQKSNQCLNMTLDKYETILYDITTAEDFLNLAVTAKESADIMETDAYNMRSEFSHICNRNQGVDGIQLVLADRKRIFYDRLSSSSVNSSWIEKVAVPETEEMLSYTMDQENENPERMFHISRKVVNYWDISEDLGEVILSVDADELSSVLDVGKGSEIYLIDDGRIVGAENEKLLGRTEDILETKRVSQKSITNTRSGWKIVLCQSLSEYQRAIREQIVFWLLLAVAVLLVFVFLIYKVTEPVMVSVNEIVDAMKNLEKDNFREKLAIKENDSIEIQKISEGFNDMTERIYHLIGQVKQSALEQKNAEISALEAQIDPHFLYNILDTINWKAIENEQYEISEMLVALAEILRYAINDAGELTTIEAEKVWLEKYILLQQEKLGEKIELIFKIPEELETYKIHKMLLQPFVENAIKYSFRGCKGEHRLTIEAAKAEEQLHLIIVNNGQCIEKVRLKELNEGMKIKNHLGISNVRKRLELYYGEDTAVYFENILSPGETTAMAVTGRVGCGKSAMLRRIGKMVLEVNGNTLLYCLDSERKSLADLQEKGTAYAQLSETEKVQDLFSQIFKELTDRMRKRKEAAVEITEEPWMILLIDDIKECSKLPDDIQLQLHRIMTKTKGYGVLVLCGIRQGDLFNFYTQDQLGVDLKSSGVALALSDTAVHYEGFYKNNFTQSQRNAELEKGFGIFFAGNGSKKIKCIDS